MDEGQEPDEQPGNPEAREPDATQAWAPPPRAADDGWDSPPPPPPLGWIQPAAAEPDTEATVYSPGEPGSVYERSWNQPGQGGGPFEPDVDEPTSQYGYEGQPPFPPPPYQSQFSTSPPHRRRRRFVVGLVALLAVLLIGGGIGAAVAIDHNGKDSNSAPAVAARPVSPTTLEHPPKPTIAPTTTPTTPVTATVPTTPAPTTPPTTAAPTTVAPTTEVPTTPDAPTSTDLTGSLDAWTLQALPVILQIRTDLTSVNDDVTQSPDFVILSTDSSALDADLQEAQGLAAPPDPTVAPEWTQLLSDLDTADTALAAAIQSEDPNTGADIQSDFATTDQDYNALTNTLNQDAGSG